MTANMPKPLMITSAPHLSGFRVCLGYETFAEAQEAHEYLARAAHPAPDAAGKLAEAVGLLRRLFDQDVSYNGSTVVIPASSHAEAIGLAQHARLLIDAHDASNAEGEK